MEGQTREELRGLGSVKRKDGKRMVTISGEAEGRSGPAVLADVRSRINQIELPPGYAISYTGENEDMTDTTRFLVMAFILAMFLISLVLITQLN